MNPETTLTTGQIRQLCERHGIEYSSHKRITNGFSHEVHRLNDDLVIKLFEPRHADKFQTERAALASGCDFKKPAFVASGTPDAELACFYIVMSYVPGAPLGSLWHLANDAQRERVMASVCENLRTINAVGPAALSLKPKTSWQAYVQERVETSVSTLAENKTIAPGEAARILAFARARYDIFSGTALRVVYWDVHFDNFIVNESFELQALVDLETIELAALDYPLFVIRKQMSQPAKYLSLVNEKHARVKDYEKLEAWYRTYYPAMFAFGSLEERAGMYQLLDALHLLKDWPQARDVRAALKRLVGG